MLDLISRFLIIGALAFGGGQAALPLVERPAVADTGWLTPAQFATGVGLSYATPGPVLILAVFIGYYGCRRAGRCGGYGSCLHRTCLAGWLCRPACRQAQRCKLVPGVRTICRCGGGRAARRHAARPRPPARPEERKFLGFSISNDGSERRIAPKALDKFKTQVRDKTRRTRGISLQQLIEDLTPYLMGWRGYFGFCQTPRVLTNLEAWIRRRLRSYLWRQWQNGHNRFNELRRRGVPKFSAAVAAGSPTGFWRMSGHPAVQQALRNHYFDSLGLPRLHVSAQA